MKSTVCVYPGVHVEVREQPKGVESLYHIGLMSQTYPLSYFTGPTSDPPAPHVPSSRITVVCHRVWHFVHVRKALYQLSYTQPQLKSVSWKLAVKPAWASLSLKSTYTLVSLFTCVLIATTPPQRL